MELENHPSEKKKQRKTTLCCLAEDKKNSSGHHAPKYNWNLITFAGLFTLTLVILLCCLSLKSQSGSKNEVQKENFYAVGDPVFARDLWMVVELASDSRGRRTRESKEYAAHVCSAISAAQAIGWTPLIVGARSPCCRSRYCRHLHPQDLQRLNYTLSGYYDGHGQTRMALKTAGFLAAIERGAHFIFQANPEVYYRAGISPKQYQSELQRQLQKTTLGISTGLVKSVSSDSDAIFDPYGHFGQTFQQLELDNVINQYKICKVKPPSMEKFLDTDGKSLDLSAPAFTIPGGRIGPFDTRNTAFGTEVFPALFLLPDDADMSEKDQYFLRSLIANALLKSSAGSAKFSIAEISTVTETDISTKSAKTKKFKEFLDTWSCTGYTLLSCFYELGGSLTQAKLISANDFNLIEMWVQDLRLINYQDSVAIGNAVQSEEQACIGPDALNGVYFHPSIRLQEQEHRSREGKVLLETFENNLKKSEAFASRNLQKLCPALDLREVMSYEKYDPHDNILVIITFPKKDYHNIPLLEIMYRHHFKNILYCGEPDPVVDEYMETYHGQSGTYFSFLPVHHKQSAGYECLLGAIEMGYHVDGFLVVNEDTLINSWNFRSNKIDPTKVWHGNEHAINVTAENLENLGTDPQDIMKSMLGILHAFQFLENVLLSDHPDLVSNELLPPPVVSAHDDHADNGHHVERRQVQFDDDVIEDDFSKEEMIMMHEDEAANHDEHEHHDMSLLDVKINGTAQEWHINIFGEIVHDEPEPEQDLEGGNEESQKVNAEVSDLLFHPANFKKSSEVPEEMSEEDLNMMQQDHFNDMMFNIKSIYKRIHDKLNLWIRFKKMRMQHHHGDLDHHEKMQEMKKALEHLNCNKAANAEICHVVASFFAVLDSNEGDSFQLVYDDIPIYYVPEALKERLYLMANLLTKHHVVDRLAFPLLLRGLDNTDNWTTLTRAELSALDASSVISRPEDLLSEAFDDKIQSLAEVESAHYLYPVDVKAVLTNEDLNSVVCRNF